jgi:hypothetical protein
MEPVSCSQTSVMHMIEYHFGYGQPKLAGRTELEVTRVALEAACSNTLPNLKPKGNQRIDWESQMKSQCQTDK